jgi:hypothetical protein
MKTKRTRLAHQFFLVLTALLFAQQAAFSAERREPKIALTLGEVHDELLVSVNKSGRTQRAMLTTLTGSTPTRILVAHSDDGLIGLVGYPQLTGTNKNAPLVRARHLFVSDQTAIVQFECPRDVQNECEEAYRTSPEFYEDIENLLQMVRKKINFTEVSHIGHGDGAVNVASIARNGGVSSIVLLSPPNPWHKHSENQNGRIFRKLKLKDLDARSLVVAHTSSNCGWADFDNAKKIADGVSLLPVSGYSAIDNKTRGDCTSLGRHGFMGREREVGFAVLNFIEQTDDLPSEIK